MKKRCILLKNLTKIVIIDRGVVMEEKLLALASRIRENVLVKGDLELIHQFFFCYSEDQSDFDILVVLAGSSLNRIEKAVQLYQKKPCPILISGGATFADGVREWERYSCYALEHGVKSTDLIIEAQSNNTYENLFNSIQLIDCKRLNHGKVLFISSAQHLFRVSLTLLQVLEKVPLQIHYMFCAVYAKNMRRETFLFSDSGRREIASELEKIVQYQLFPYLN